MTGRRRGDRRPGREATAADEMVIYGWHSAVAALANPARRVKRLIATRNALARLEAEGVPLPFSAPEPSEPRDLDRLLGSDAVHQGIAVVVKPLPELDIADVAEAGLLVVLDQITDPHNVGAIVRSAAAFGAAAVIMTERHGPAESGVLAKAASGGLEHVHLVRVPNLARALHRLGDSAVERLGLDSEHAAPLEAVEPSPRTALVLGAEGKGLRRLTREHCDRLVRIDAPGPIKSLNVSNAAAVALHWLSRSA